MPAHRFSLKNIATRLFLALCALLLAYPARAQDTPIANDAYTFNIYAVNYLYFPIVQVYMRTWNHERRPLQNVNYANIGVMVEGKSYNPKALDDAGRFQYDIHTLENRKEGIRTVLVLDCSISMAGEPFAAATKAMQEYVEQKRPADQIAIIAIRDTVEGYELVSGFEKNPSALKSRLESVACDSKRTRLYDSVAAALELCTTVSQGGIDNSNPEYAVLSTIVVFSDGHDEGSAIQRAELIGRMGNYQALIPIYSVAYSKQSSEHFLNLEALSKATHGVYWTAPQAQDIGNTMREIHRINRSDYVVTFRAYTEPDGRQYPFKIGIAWPSDTGRAVMQGGVFEAIESPAAHHDETKKILLALDSIYANLPLNKRYKTAEAITPPVVEKEKNQENAVAATTPTGDSGTPVTPPNTETPPKPKSYITSDMVMVGCGLALLLVVLVAVHWVRVNGAPGDDGSHDTSNRTEDRANDSSWRSTSGTGTITEQPENIRKINRS